MNTNPSTGLILIYRLWCNRDRHLVNQPFNLIILVEDLHVVVFQSQIGVAQPGEKSKRKGFMRA